jgi:hypothetical protein
LKFNNKNIQNEMKEKKDRQRLGHIGLCSKKRKFTPRAMEAPGTILSNAAIKCDLTCREVDQCS